MAADVTAAVGFFVSFFGSVVLNGMAVRVGSAPPLLFMTVVMLTVLMGALRVATPTGVLRRVSGAFVVDDLDDVVLLLLLVVLVRSLLLSLLLLLLLVLLPLPEVLVVFLAKIAVVFVSTEGFAFFSSTAKSALNGMSAVLFTLRIVVPDAGCRLWGRG